jgi:hypothetical protein
MLVDTYIQGTCCVVLLLEYYIWSGRTVPSVVWGPGWHLSRASFIPVWKLCTHARYRTINQSRVWDSDNRFDPLIGRWLK